MGSTFTSLHYHIVFSTKHRHPIITASWRERLHEYLGGTVNGLKGFSRGVGGTDDHVHLLVGLKSGHCLADFMRELKKSSSAWVHDEIEEHHRKQSFIEELTHLLEEAGIDYDPKWLE